jgi:anti-sigma factor RsiW
MDRNNNHSDAPLDCRECVDGLHEYLDGTLEKTRSLQFFLHLRDCSGCQTEHDNLQALFGMLESLPDHEVPADFDAKILASVPYAAYRAMEPIRRERVPVFLEEEFLPAWVRSSMTRLAGVGVALMGVILGQTVEGLSSVAAISLLGLLPELLVRLQGVGRRAALAVLRSEG